MELIKEPLTVTEIQQIQQKYGDYVKITADIEKKEIVVGCLLHADGEKILLKNDSYQDDIWGGGLDFIGKEIDTTAVLNIRPRLENNSLEILDPERRKNFISLTKYIFNNLWQN